MEIIDFLEVAVAYYKDKVQAETIQKLKEEYLSVLSTKADCDRQKAKTLIMQKAKLDIALKKFECTYNMLKSKCGSIVALDNYIRDLKSQIAAIVYKKNNHIFDK